MVSSYWSLTLAFTRYGLCKSFCTRISSIIRKNPLSLGTPLTAPHRPHYCAMHYIPLTPLQCNICHLIFMKAISCKGQRSPRIRRWVRHARERGRNRRARDASWKCPANRCAGRTCTWAQETG